MAMPTDTSMKTNEMLCVLSGFGGQGVLFAGKVMANAGLLDGRNVSLSDEAIGSPFITKPTALIALNQPSVEKFGPTLVEGGIAIIDTTLAMNADAVELPAGVRRFSFKATQLAEDKGLKGLANIVCLGKLWAETQFADLDVLEAALRKCVPPKHANLLEPNLKALHMGIEL